LLLGCGPKGNRDAFWDAVKKRSKRAGPRVIYPKVPAQHFQERAGVNAVAMAAGQMNLIWRETPVGDVGVDGQLEYVTSSGQASGRIAAVQIKSGPSYFRYEQPDGWKFHPEPKHRTYWENFPTPVILVLHDPAGNMLYWIDARQYLREPSKMEHEFILVPKSNLFNAAEREMLFQNAGDFSEPFIDNEEVLAAEMINRRTSNAGLPLSFMQLFTMGLTNIARSVYFGMDLVCELAEQNLYDSGFEYGIGLGQPEYEYLFKYIKFLSSQSIVDLNISDFMIDWNDRQLIPSFIAPLTRRGHALKQIISDAEDRMLERGELVAEGGYRVAQESFVQLVFLPGGPIRVARVRTFEEKFRAAVSGTAKRVEP
jgi:hypothetical protein